VGGRERGNLAAPLRAGAGERPGGHHFDELDSFARQRGTYLGSGVEHSMVNQLLTELDGFRRDELVFVVATTNFAESLDPALLRPGASKLVLAIRTRTSATGARS